MALLYVPGNRPRLLAGLYRGEPEGEASLYVTEDDQTWVPSDSGLNPAGTFKGVWALAVDPGSPQRLFMGTDYPVLRSEDGGRNWNYVYGSPDTFGHGVAAVVVSKHRPGRLWVGVQSGAEAGLVLRSLDGGGTWKTSLKTESTGTVHIVAEDRDRADRIWASITGGLYVSEDGGENWALAFSTTAWDLAFLGDSLFLTSGAAISDTLYDFRLRLFASPIDCLCWDELPVPEGVRATAAVIADDRGRLVMGTLGSGVWVVTFGRAGSH